MSRSIFFRQILRMGLGLGLWLAILAIEQILEWRGLGIMMLMMAIYWGGKEEAVFGASILMDIGHMTTWGLGGVIVFIVALLTEYSRKLKIPRLIDFGIMIIGMFVYISVLNWEWGGAQIVVIGVMGMIFVIRERRKVLW